MVPNDRPFMLLLYPWNPNLRPDVACEGPRQLGVRSTRMPERQ